MPETPYAETEVLLAVLNNNRERLNELLDDMLPHEMEELHTALDVLQRSLEDKLGEAGS
jgi:hypothetical protein